MTETRIREKIMENPYGKGALIGFENCVMPVEFFKGSDGYYIYKANTKHMLDDMICHSQNVEGLVQFMQGALWFRLNGKVRFFKLCKLYNENDCILCNIFVDKYLFMVYISIIK